MNAFIHAPARNRSQSPDTQRTSRAHLEILCPTLLRPIPEHTGLRMRTPAIARLLARAERRPGRNADPVAALMGAFGLDGERPTAPIAVLGEGVAVEPERFWMHADPIHLRPDRERLLVYAGTSIAPDPDEAKALVEGFNRHFADEGLQLIAPAQARWYLRVDRPMPGWPMAPLHRIQGGSMAEYLPRGSEACDWVRLLNEIQMLFHADPVNRRREAAGRPIINGIWIWGGGTLPRPSEFGSAPDTLVGDHPLLLGLARLTGRPRRSLANWLDDPGPITGQQLVFWDRPWRAWLEYDLETWSGAIRELEAAIERLWTPLRVGRLGTIQLDPCDGETFALTTRQTWRFWRRRARIHD
ncbi:phosphoglycerate mutase [Thermochromatium tepidum]|uniref:Phosphoglycerate mutase n=1 Tax=Thermochromatium tepidum ATCC 43061 TaxID=316276 RepID=A0A6I6DXQ9_THETI|nr:phosphoglycerate mutase [Thermochromatium tepidum]QGU31545.1 phosphoglycerate mutase [Thermochromatium tepidum ATCC 43061]